MSKDFSENHKAGFVNILGKPNVGKSTFVNNFTEYKLNIITTKPQTTRHRIFAIINEKEYQIVLSDSPGIIDDPNYKMHEKMNAFAWSSVEDADILLFFVDVWEDVELTQIYKQQFQKVDGKIFFVLNKIDQKSDDEVQKLMDKWGETYDFDAMYKISALKNVGIEEMMEGIINQLPTSPPFYPKEQITDKSQRFFVSEIIREKILKLYRKEIPYAAEVDVHWFKEDDTHDPPIINIGADIYVERESQKGIMIGKGGSKINKLGREARKDIEEFVGHQVYLELLVKVRKDWRSNEHDLRGFGYEKS